MPNGYANIPNFSSQVSAAGDNQSGATALSAIFNQVTSGTGGVALPQSLTGEVIQVVNLTADSIDVYPVEGGTDSINGGAENTAYSLAEYTGAQFVCYDTGNWSVPYTWSGQGLS